MGDNVDALHALAEQWQSGNPAPGLVNRVWDLLEPSTFALQSLAVLDSRQALEKLLWPSFSPTSSNQHVVTLAALINYKKQTRTLSWALFADHESRFAAFFQRVLSLLLDPSLPASSRNVLLGFVIASFQSLEQDLIRQNCAPLVSIAIWENLHSDSYREQQLDVAASRRKAWRSAKKKFISASPEVQTRIRLERAWLYTMTLDFFKRINPSNLAAADLLYCEKFLELLTDLISQLPTRRYTIVLLKDLNFLPMLRVSKLHQSGKSTTFADLVSLFQHFANFVIADNGDVQDTQSSAHYAGIARLQKLALQHFDPKLKVLALSNVASLTNPDELRSHLDVLSDLELEQLCQHLDLRTSYPPSAGIATGRAVFLNIVQHAFSPPVSLLSDDEDVLPTERTLYDPSLLRNETFDGTSPLGVPKLNLQYLSLSDFLWRSLKLQQAEAFYEIRKDMESIVRKLNPTRPRPGAAVEWKGFSKMAIPIEKPAIIDVAQPNVGDVVPAHVRAEVVLDVSRLGDKVRREWETLRPKDVVFLLAIQPSPEALRKNGNHDPSLAHSEQFFSLLRAAEVVQVQDDKGKPIRSEQGMNGYSHSSQFRRLVLDLDPIAFHHDKERLASGQSDVYAQVNILGRRAGRENNFRPMLNSIRHLLSTNGSLPDWLQEVYLGYGLPSAASYPNIHSDIPSIDFLDTFLDWDHLRESFTDVAVQSDNNAILSPPFVLDFSQRISRLLASNSRKRRHDQMENDSTASVVKVSTYKAANTGPYPQDKKKRNSIRFTPRQTEAIISGVHPGLSLIVGPPGTGKTDVATQIINLLYHNFPDQRILLVAHSNQALNQLFQKIMALDIDSRHLLRLGHGEEGLETDQSYSKHGRVESFMENRTAFLAEVNRLAVSMGAQGAHGNSCETADYFNQVFVQPAWSRFWAVASAEAVDREVIADAFPFKKFFSNAPVPDLFPSEASPEQYREIAQGCQYHLNKLFGELESIRPFEVLRNQRDQANHLLMKEARIIAMTSTHASIRHQEIISLGFKYDTLIMEEAAQITEIESFIPCALQSADSRTGQLPLQRIVLVGDHLQNSPIIQNFALRDYSNLEQSLFLRFVRLGVPTTMLDAQGRCRPSIANLFSWRYPGLKDLPHINEQHDFKHANAGFAHEFQFINIDDYQGQGEREPSPHFIQNLGEAEYAVALYQYMRLLGYPAHSITILAAYAGQRALIRDVLEHRCKSNRLFGLPRLVTTIDKYQGEQNDYIILSLTRTKTVGYLRDVRRLTVALSRARLGLYVLGRKTLFETCFEMQTAMERLSSKGNAEGQLEVFTGEMFPTQRLMADEVAVTQIHGLEHLGQYVYEMTQAKVKSMGGNVQMAPSESHDVVEDEEDLDAEAQADAEVDPLHENV